MNPKTIVYVSSLVSCLSALVLTEMIRRTSELQGVQNSKVVLLLLLCFGVLLALAVSWLSSLLLDDEKKEKKSVKKSVGESDAEKSVFKV